MQNTQIDQAVSLIKKIDFNEPFGQVENFEQVNRIISIIAQTDAVDIIFPLIIERIEKNSKKNNEYFLIKIRIALILHSMGDVINPRQLLSDIDFSIVESLDQLLVLGKNLVRLGMFVQALEVFDLVEKKDASCTQHLFYKANTYLCLHNYKQATNLIHREISENGESNRALLAKCRLLKYAHRYDEALKIIDFLLKKEKSPNPYCINLIEKGKILRLNECIDSALTCFRKASGVVKAKKLWRMVAFFEYSISNACLGDFEKAIEIAMDGHRLTVDNKKSHYNPSSVLKDYLIQTASTLNNRNGHLVEKNYNSNLWPVASFPYDIWIDFLSICIFSSFKPINVGKIIEKFISDPRMEKSHDLLETMKKTNDGCLKLETIEVLVDALWPYLSGTSYRKSLMRFMVRTALS
ncbi:uncharacterized protein Dvar_38720 [Desulfosarcina variabilis str. Montpellier]|uniref:tetratricopeptide repeat protein n=1 Tax=Desulfosarcina variabilis TaxID=2300 RepID=UPI003AFA3E59